MTSDVELYEFWAEDIVDGGRPYTDVPVQYPPGLLPFILAPETTGDLSSYRTSLIGLMLLMDALGLIGLVLIADRHGSSLGPWIWVVAIPLIGPLVYLRLDLVPAVATLWAVERASRGAWAGAGAWLGLGVVAKLYPILLLPISFICSPERRRFVVGAVVVPALALLPFVLSPRGLVRNVLSTTQEGTCISKAPGACCSWFPRSWDRTSPCTSAPVLQRSWSWLVGREDRCSRLGRPHGRAISLVRRSSPSPRGTAGLADLMYATLAMSVALSTVFSPQFVLWLLASGAAALCSSNTSIRMPVLLLVPIAVLTQWLFPFAYGHLLAMDARGMLLLATRNLLVLASGSLAFLLLWKKRSRRPVGSLGVGNHR